jgi:beta-mannosidase
MNIFDLSGRWHFRAINKYRTLPPNVSDVTRWMDGTVPGTVHTDLLANEKIPDPFFGMNEIDVQWIDTQQWLYRREFNLPEKFLEEDTIDLVARGLDTYADIRVNGKMVGNISNMFVEHRFSVKKFLRTGKNTIEILFDSPTVQSKSLEQNYGRLDVARESHRVYVRKSQYSFGWDWGPKLTTSGIWRDIFLEAYSFARLVDPFVKTIVVNRQNAAVEVSVNVEKLGDERLTLQLSVDGWDAPIEQTVRVSGKGVKFQVQIPQPHLWWPNGYGDQPMYTAILTLLHEGIELHRIEVPFAIRTVRLLQEEDDQGESFIIEINGQKIFCKGANWIPSDSFIPRIPNSTYEKLLWMAKDAHMNMIRVWGGGIYEQGIFYSLCDRLGLMVWQDFMFACGEYPQQQWFVRKVKDEAEKVVKRLRNHPSIVIWCGNNECEWIFCTNNPKKTPNDMKGAEIFRDVLSEVCRRLDSTRPYWRSTPFGRGFPNSESNGNHHQWMVWSAWKDFEEYTKNNARFVTEFGFQAPANLTTFIEITLPKDRNPQSAVMEHHNKQEEGTERLFRFQAAHYRVDSKFDEFIYKAQLVQAEALKTGVEHWRRRKFRTAGSIFWQLNDCWPVSSWSVIDSSLRPKAAYYYAKKFFAPILVSFKRTIGGDEVWISNDLLEEVPGVFDLTFRSFEGEVIWKKSFQYIIPPNSSKKIFVLDPTVYTKSDHSSHYFLAQFIAHGVIVSENRLFFVEPKYLQLPHVKISACIKRENFLILRSSRFVKNVCIEIDRVDLVFDDNYFDLDAGVEKKVHFISTLSTRKLKRKIQLRRLS